MKIKLAILEKDEKYLKRIATTFISKYADKIEVYSCTSFESAIEILETKRIDVFISSDLFEINCSELPIKCGFAYFTDLQNIETIKGQRAICKYQKIDLIYKQILSIYSENVGNVYGMQYGNESTKIIAFSSPVGGVGTTSVAISCATFLSRHNKKVLYLNLEEIGSIKPFISSEGQFTMSDVIYSLKSVKANLAMKLESTVRQDDNGVYFFAESKNGLDMLELGIEEITKLISELRISGLYDYIIIDVDFRVDEKMITILKQAHEVVIVGDGSDISNIKIDRALNCLIVIDDDIEANIDSCYKMLYNRFSSKYSSEIENCKIRNIGIVPRYEHNNSRQVIEQISKLDIFKEII